MDFLDPKKQRAHMIRLIVGYVLIGVAIVIATTILLYQAYGFGIDRRGEVIQNGLVFVSSQPDAAKIYLNTKLEKETTDTKMQIAEGSYRLELQREGYHAWERDIQVKGGRVDHYTYPMLFPASLKTTTVKNYESAPALATNSPDRRWLLIQQPGSLVAFDQYDLRDPKRVIERLEQLTIPASVLSLPGDPAAAWKLAEWSNNNRHVLLEHHASGQMEYVLLDRADPQKSINLTRRLKLEPGMQLTLRDKKHDQYYLFDPAAGSVTRTTWDENADILPELTGVLAFKSYGSNVILYVTQDGAAKGQVASMLQDGDTTYKVREHPEGGPYLIDLVRYDGDWIVAAGSSAENKVYIYKNPQSFRKAGKKVLVPLHVVKLTAPNYLAFSSNTQILMVENGNTFATYDIENERGYDFTTAEPIDAPNTHASWMDGHRIVYPSGGKLVIFDYDNINRRTLVPMTSAYGPFFDRNYRYLYTVAPGDSAGREPALTSTPMLVPDDL